MISAPPQRDAIANRVGGLIGRVWSRWFMSVQAAVNAQPIRLGAVSLTLQSASITATAIETPTLTAGSYLVLMYQQVTQAATTSSSLTPFVTVTSNAQTVTQTGTAMTGNALTTGQGTAFVVNVDASTTIKYGVTYASVGGTVMKFLYTATVLQVPV